MLGPAASCIPRRFYFFQKNDVLAPASFGGSAVNTVSILGASPYGSVGLTDT